MQPYQRAAEARRSGEEYPLQILKSSGMTALGGGVVSLGSKALNKLVPAIGSLINSYVPEDIAIKGLSKIDPRFKGFIEGAIKEGYSFDDIREFLGDKINKSQQATQTNPLQDFETNYPDVAQALQNTINNGQSPDAAAAILKSSSSFGKKVKDIEKATGKNFVDYILEIFGPQASSQQPAPMQEQMQKMNPQMQQQGNQAVDAQLMAALNKILSM